MAPFHRSRLFWLGLPGLIFLGWLWLGSPTRTLRIGNSCYLEALSYPDALEFVAFDDSSRFRWRVKVSEAVESDRANPFKPLFRIQKLKLHSSTYVYLSMRPWIPIAAYSVLWPGILAVWLRRKSRLMAAAIQA